MLPSSLFYQSTLQCRVPDSKSHPDAPFPLSFVCSSIEEQENSIQGTNIEEIEVLLKEVQKYFKEWPRNWDENDNRVCIMSPSANQVRLALWGEFVLLLYSVFVEVLTRNSSCGSKGFY